MATVLHSGAPGDGTKAVWVHVHGGAFGGGEHAWGDKFIKSCRGKFAPGILFVAAEVLTDNIDDTVAKIVETCQQFAQADVPLILSGSSSGGYHAIEAAKEIDDLAALILLCPVVNPEQRMEYLNCRLDDGDMRKWLPEGVPALSEKAASTIKGLQGSFKGLRDDYTLPDVRTLMIAGRRDANVPLCTLVDAMDTVSTTYIVDAGHALQKELTDYTAGLIRGFLRKHGVYGGEDGGVLSEA